MDIITERTLSSLRLLRDQAQTKIARKRAELQKLGVPAQLIEQRLSEIRDAAYTEAVKLAGNVISECEESMEHIQQWLPRCPTEWKATPERVPQFIDGCRAQLTTKPDPRRFDSLPTAELIRRAGTSSDLVDVADIELALKRRAELGEEAAGAGAAQIDLVAAVMAHPRALAGVARYTDLYKTRERFVGRLEAIRTGGRDEGDIQASYDAIRAHRDAGERGYADTQPDGTLRWIPEEPQPGALPANN